MRKKSYKTCKPDSVFPFREMVTIYLEQRSHVASSCQPAGIGRAALNRLPIWHFSTQGLPLSIVTDKHRGLLHRIFTLTATSRQRR